MIIAHGDLNRSVHELRRLTVADVGTSADRIRERLVIPLFPGARYVRPVFRAFHSLGCLVGAAFGLTIFGFEPASVQAQKKLDWEYTGSVSATLIANPSVIADVYSVDAVEGERLNFSTTLTTVDTTIRIVGPDAGFDLFNDDGNDSERTSNTSFVAAIGGTYLVVVASYRGEGAGGDYALNYERRPCFDDECATALRSAEKP